MGAFASHSCVHTMPINSKIDLHLVYSSGTHQRKAPTYVFNLALGESTLLATSNLMRPSSLSKALSHKHQKPQILHRYKTHMSLKYRSNSHSFSSCHRRRDHRALLLIGSYFAGIVIRFDESEFHRDSRVISYNRYTASNQSFSISLIKPNSGPK